MRNIFVTNFDGSNDNVMIFTESLTVDEVTQRLKEQKQSFEEIYEVQDHELPFYIYEPCYL